MNLKSFQDFVGTQEKGLIGFLYANRKAIFIFFTGSIVLVVFNRHLLKSKGCSLLTFVIQSLRPKPFFETNTTFVTQSGLGHYFDGPKSTTNFLRFYLRPYCQVDLTEEFKLFPVGEKKSLWLCELCFEQPVYSLPALPTPSSVEPFQYRVFFMFFLKFYVAECVRRTFVVLFFD